MENMMMAGPYAMTERPLNALEKAYVGFQAEAAKTEALENPVSQEAALLMGYAAGIIQ